MRPEMPTGTHRSAQQWLEATLPHIKNNAVIHAPKSRKVIDMVASHDLLKLKALPFRSSKLDHIWEQGGFPFGSDAGVLWTLMGTGPVVHPRKLHVMFVHDINFILIPNVFNRRFRQWYHFACALAARRADMIVCFTDYVKKSLIERLGLSPQKIRVIPQGPGLRGVAPSIVAINEPSNYFLCVGSLQPHKNLKTVLLAWKEFIRSHVGWKLKIVGRAQARFEMLSIEKSLMLQSSVEFTGYVDDETLVDLYQNAAAFLYPSTEEGFGLPVVEAFYCGCPVVTSNSSCLPEVAGGAAILVNPHSPEALTRAILHLADNPEERNKLREAGLIRAKAFNWDSAGAEMAELLTGIEKR